MKAIQHLKNHYRLQHYVAVDIFVVRVLCPSGVLNEEYQVRGNLAPDIGRDLVVRKSKCCV